MNIVQNITTRELTITYNEPDYHLFIPMVIIQKVVEGVKIFIEGAILDPNEYSGIYTYTPIQDGLYEIRVLFFSTSLSSSYYIPSLPATILYSEDNGDTSIQKTIEDIKDITSTDIDQGTIDEDNWIEYSGLYNNYIDATQGILDEYMLDKDTYKNKQFQQLLDMSITIIKYLIVQSLFIEAGRVLDKLLPYTTNT